MIGIHFFNLVPVLLLVELVPSLLTSPAVIEEAAPFAPSQLASTRSARRTGPGSWSTPC